MPELFIKSKWRAKDGTEHDSEVDALDHEARMRLIARTDAVLAQIGVLKPDPKHGSRAFDDEFDDYSGEIEARLHAFNAGVRGAIEAAIKAGLIKGPGNA